MFWVGILATSCGMLSIVWICYVVIRLKHVQLRRMLVTLEWLALTRANRDREEQGQNPVEAALIQAEHTWDEVQILFQSGHLDYIKLVWNAPLRELYWSNRFGAELYRLSQSLLPVDRRFDDHPEANQRAYLIAQHISDFVDRARAIFAPMPRRGKKNR